jgi:hypothetical protein
MFQRRKILLQSDWTYTSVLIHAAGRSSKAYYQLPLHNFTGCCSQGADRIRGL